MGRHLEEVAHNREADLRCAAAKGGCHVDHDNIFSRTCHGPILLQAQHQFMNQSLTGLGWHTWSVHHP